MAISTSCCPLDFSDFLPLFFGFKRCQLTRLGNGNCASLYRFPDGLSGIEKGKRCTNGLNAAAKQHCNVVLIEPAVELV
ncbi:hypothetical protein KLPN111865_25835 [Klebsiella pneumoniae]